MSLLSENVVIKRCVTTRIWLS